MPLFLEKSGFLPDRRFPIRVSSGTSGEGSDPWTENEHYHNFEELVLIDQGYGTHIVNDREFPVERGDVFLIQKDQHHFFTNRRKMRHLNIAFDIDIFHSLREEFAELPGFHALFNLDPTQRCSTGRISHLRLTEEQFAVTRDLFDQMTDKQTDSGIAENLAVYLIFKQLVLHLCRIYECSSNIPTRRLMQLAGAIIFIENNYWKPISISDLLKETNMSRSTFMRKFKEGTGKSPVDHINKVRISHAKGLLRAPALSIHDIAIDVGFSGSNYFCRVFSKLVGMSPMAYRKML